MTKQEMVDQLAEGIGLARMEVQAVLEGFAMLVVDAVAKGQRVELRRFGSWKPVVRKGRQLRTPGGSQVIEIPAHTTVVFVPAAEFRARVADAQIGHPPDSVSSS